MSKCRFIPKGYDMSQVKIATNFALDAQMIGEPIEKTDEPKVSSKDGVAYVKFYTTRFSGRVSSETVKGSGLPFDEFEAGTYTVKSVNPFTCQPTVAVAPTESPKPTKPSFITAAKWNQLSEDDQKRWTSASKEEWDAR